MENAGVGGGGDPNSTHLMLLYTFCLQKTQHHISTSSDFASGVILFHWENIYSKSQFFSCKWLVLECEVAVVLIKNSS